jgi:4-hydroxybenzoate polyprenyltransferase
MLPNLDPKLTSMLENASVSLLVTIVVVTVLIYFIPSFVALLRRHTYLKQVLVLNVILGWSTIGWVALLVWAFAGGEIPDKLKRWLKKPKAEREG